MTVLFADLVGFSTFAESMDPEELQTVITETFSELVGEIEVRSGRVEKFIGDAIVAIFGVPIAHEDDPVRASAAAIAMIDVIHRLSQRTQTPLRLRIGINSGLVVAGSVGDGTQTGVIGDAVIVAARLQQAADADEILVSASVWRRIRDRFKGDHVGLLDIKGRAKQVDAYRVLAPGRSDDRRRAPFVGRKEELALLELLWSSAVKGNAHAVSLVGEPGVGKSRMLAEFPSREDSLDVRIDCSGERAFGPFLDLLEVVLGQLPTDLPDLQMSLAQLSLEPDVALLLGALLGLADAPPVVAMADEHRKRQVFTGFYKFLLAASRGRASLLILEDLHLCDQSSLELLGFLLERVSGVPLMVVVSHRPGFEQMERWMIRPSHMGVRLELLSAAESVALARGYLSVESLPADLERLVAMRAEGNPFFIEELLEALLELGYIEVLNGEVRLGQAQIVVPDTIEGTVLARIDRLPAGQRALLQYAAVIGRSFSTSLIQGVMGRADATNDLESLARAQILVADGPEQWAFKHALIQEVAYETILLQQRRTLHRKVAETLEAGQEDDPNLLERLAEHYAQAEDAEQARRYAVRAGDVASERMGFAEARRHYQTALQLWKEGDEEGRLRLLMKLAWASLITGESAGARTSLIEAEAGWRALGKTREAGAALATQGRVHFFSGETDRAAKVLDEAIAMLSTEEPSPELVQAMVWSSILNVVTGRVDEGIELSARGLATARQLGIVGAEANLLTSLGVLQVVAGDAKGLDRLKQALDLARRTGEPEPVGRAYINLGIAMRALAEHREGAALCEEGREAMRHMGAPSFDGVIAANQSIMLAELARFEEAERVAHEVLGPLRSVTVGPGLLFAGYGLGLSLLRRGRYLECRSLLDEMLPMARRIGGTMFLCTIPVLEAELEDVLGNHATARRAATEAVASALDGSAVADWFLPLITAARLGSIEGFETLLAAARKHATYPALSAALAETEAVLSGGRAEFGLAAELYAELELPYQEMRCRLEAKDANAAKALINRFGLENSPVGSRAAGARVGRRHSGKV